MIRLANNQQMEEQTMDLTQEQMLALKYFCDDYDYDLRKDYSGRGMYGSTCIGIVTDTNPFALALEMVEAAEEYDDFPIETFKKAAPRTDNMGLSSIIYFSCIHAPETVEA
jgi:hypothetical protein